MSEHKDASKASAEVMDLLADLDAEFGKKPKGPKAEGHKERNQAFHAANPTVRFAKSQLDSLKFADYYSWDLHRQRVRDIEDAQAEGVPELQWLPEANVTYVVNQTCACCKTVTTFVGQEYIRFRGRRRWFTDIRGELHETYPTRLVPIARVDGSLLMYGLPSGDPLPDLVEELNETVRRCAGCISVESKALDLWVSTQQPSPQADLLEETEEVARTNLSGNQMKAYVGREFGERFKKPASTNLTIDLPEVKEQQ